MQPLPMLDPSQARQECLARLPGLLQGLVKGQPMDQHIMPARLDEIRLYLQIAQDRSKNAEYHPEAEHYALLAVEAWNRLASQVDPH